VIPEGRDASGKDGTGYPARCSINLSAETIRNHEFPAFLVEQLKLFKAVPGAIVFELTEADAEAHSTGLVNTVKRMKKTGCGVALTGYNGDRISFDALKKLAVDIVKPRSRANRNTSNSSALTSNRSTSCRKSSRSRVSRSTTTVSSSCAFSTATR